MNNQPNKPIIYLSSEAKDEFDWDTFVGQVDKLRAEIDSARSRKRFVCTTSLDGFRESFAAALLVRCSHVLGQAVEADRTQLGTLALLGARTVFEGAVCGRHFFVEPQGADQFVRVCVKFQIDDVKIARLLGETSQGVHPELDQLLPPKIKKNANVASFKRVTEELDAAEGRTVRQQFSAERCYDVYYRLLSNGEVHAGLASVRDYLRTDPSMPHMLTVVAPPIGERDPAPLISAAFFTCELAAVVFDAFGIERQVLDAIGLRIPKAIDDKIL